jgi:hypothetical protein
VRGDDQQQASMFSYISPEERVPKDHPLRVIRVLDEAVLKELSPQYVLIENRQRLVVDTQVTHGMGTAEREAVRAMAEAIAGPHRITLGGDRNYDTHEFLRELRALRMTPHVAQHRTGRSSAFNGPTTRHPGYAISQQRRKRVEEIFGWLKTVGLLRKTRLRGVAGLGWMFAFAAAAYNLVRMPTLAAVPQARRGPYARDKFCTAFTAPE